MLPLASSFSGATNMGKKDAEFMKKLVATFKTEAEEHLHAISSGLVELEKGPEAEKYVNIIETVFREAHSLKGAARAVDIAEIATLSHSLESVFSGLKHRDLVLSRGLFDTLHKAVDTLGGLVLSAGAERPTEPTSPITNIIQELGSTMRGVSLPPGQEELKESQAKTSPPVKRAADEPPFRVPAPQPLTEGSPFLAETVRISTAKLNSLLNQAEELLSPKLTSRQRAAELGEINEIVAKWKKERVKIQPELRVIQQSQNKGGHGNGRLRLPEGGENTNSHMMKLLAFLERNDATMESLKGKLASLAKSADQDHRTLTGMVDALLEDMKKVLMFPFSSLLEGFPKLVRDLSQDRGKETELVIQGGEIEIDRRILEEIKDPLVHLLRNCVDHGLEASEEREPKKKPRRGMITIAISTKNSDKVEILVSDDGAGVDVAKVRGAALKLGIVSSEEAEKMNDQDVLSLIFRSGVSTSPIITDLSGRGLGLAIVREKIEKLGGILSLETHPDVGTIFRMVLPLTLTTFRGVLVGAAEHLIILPTTYVERVVRVSRKDIKTVENRETIQLGAQAVSLVWLGDALGLPRKSSVGDSADTVYVAVLGSADRRVAFLVDEIHNEQEVLMKPLGRHFSRSPNIAGVTVLGTGKIVPIVNVPDLLQSAVRVGGEAAGAAAPVEQPQAKRKSILVVEDSITARTLLKNIVESAGYRVKTTVDGVDAFTTLKTEEFDLVVSDVEMPRMSGFDLTAKIRAEKRLSQLPVVLVTALESREDRERGIDVGANAYIVKSSFDQSNLLEVIRSLI
jgi:two-component system chemotaxis sensor kinase CheA